MNKVLEVNTADLEFIRDLLKKNCLATVYKATYKRFFKEEVEYDYKYNTIVYLVNKIDGNKEDL